MRHLTIFAMLFLCISIFSNCSKKTTETFTPTETFHPPEVKTMVSKNPPSTSEGTFWIGPSMNHSFSIEAGSINLSGVYAVNNNQELEKDRSGNLLFYPKKSLSDMEFFKSEIGNLDFEEGYLYKVDGIKHYLGSKLWGVIVTKVHQRVKDGNNAEYHDLIDYDVDKTLVEYTPTETWHPDPNKTDTKTIETEPEVTSMVSPDPPSYYEGIYWIGSSTNHSFSAENGSVSVKGAYAINTRDELKKTRSGDLIFYPTKSLSEIEFFSSKIDNFDFQPGYYYQVDGTLYYGGSTLKSVTVERVIKRVKDRNYKNDGKEVVFGGSNSNTSSSSSSTSSNSSSSTTTKVKSKPKTNPHRWKTTRKSTGKTSVSVEPSNPATTTTTSTKTSKTKNGGISMVSSDPPSIEEGIFWIGSSRNHSFSTSAGSISVNGAYAINNNKDLKKNPSGDLMFYPSKTMSEIEFFDSKIDDFDYQEGYYYKIKGAKHYLGSSLAGISVDKVLKKVKDSKYKKVEVKSVDGNSNKTTKTSTNTQRWQTSKTKKTEKTNSNRWQTSTTKNNQDVVTSMVSPNPPSLYEGTFWIGSSLNHNFSNEVGAMSIRDAYAINKNEKLEKNPTGDIIFYTKSSTDIEFFDSKIDNFNYEVGNYYQVEGTLHYLGNELSGVSVSKVLQKVKDTKSGTSGDEEVVFYRKRTKTLKHSNPQLELYNEDISEDFGSIEEKIIFIGPERTKAVGIHGNEIECYQAQFDTYSRSAEWEGYCGWITGFEPEPGYMYKIKISRKYLSKMEAELTMDAPSYSDELVSVLKKQRM